ncbi:efflux RND transporter permease subunit [Bdellovibrio svalbardensis]|uniref:Efflux RND transporter permease subunit n=1 Tax=Bdellovibrio svalbardensis TaxID=2972972 RepID=A0ABT6DP34_9BACT|nr:efflux RND transporter permease subunit [Bdellovibrio svalbardensis]MDG0818252.1 efflux RND transporter permease subunit [Bdellovibrio svalbardensis]
MNLPSLSIRRPITILCVVLLMLILGAFSLVKMPVDLFPDVTFPVLAIQVTYPGASPLDLEKQVSKPIEDELGSLSGLKTLTSSNLDGVALIVLEFNLGTDIKEMEQEVRNRIGNIRRDLPSDIYEPIVRRFDPADQPIVTLALTTELPDGQAFDLANETVKPLFDRLKDVGQVEIYGGRKQEIHVVIDKNKIQDRKISMLQVSRRIMDTSKDIPIGKVWNTKDETALRTRGEFESLKQLSEVNVNFLGSDRPVLISDIGTVVRSLEDEKTMGRIKGKKALLLQVYKQRGSNTVQVADSVKKNIEKANAYLKEKGLNGEVRMVRDTSRPIRLNVADVNESIIIGIILCVIVVFFFLGSARSTLITGMALPNSLLGGFVIMYAMGFTINLMTLLALSLAVGLLIDDAIVVRENIFRHLEMGKKPKDAALDGTKEVAMAVVATTLVVIAVFGPISFLGGIVGQFFKQFGLTVVFTMIISIFDAFTVAPMMSAYLAHPDEHKKGTGIIGRMLSAFDRFQTKLEDIYEVLLKFTLRRPKTVLFGGVLVFVLSLGTIAFIPKTFLPANDAGEFVVSIETPVGSSLTATSAFTSEVEKIFDGDPAVDIVVSTIGTANNESNKASMFIRLVERKQRSMTTTDYKESVRKKLQQFQDRAIAAVGDIDAVGSAQKPLNVNFTGQNLDELNAYVQKVVERVKKIPGLVDVDTNFRAGKPEFHVIFDRKRSEALGVSTVTAGAELRNRTEGNEDAIYRENGIDYKIRIRFEEKYRDLRTQFATTSVPNSNNNMIPLSRIAKGEETKGYSQINRQNKNRFIQVSANLAKGGALGTASAELERIIKVELPPPSGIDFKFQGQADDFKDLINNMLIAIVLGVIFIYLVLASLYESFITPFTILLALPLAMTGAFLALLIFGKTIDIFSLIGIVLLLGVVAKNSILLVDYTNHLLHEGLDRNSALLKACRTRLRPILMTSLALIAGMIPIAIGLNEASAMRTSMGIAIIGGLISSTLLTLVVVPAAFGFIDDFRAATRRFLAKISGYQP